MSALSRERLQKSISIGGSFLRSLNWFDGLIAVLTIGGVILSFTWL